ncbi:MAG: response regulator, partial [Syntrophaceae bacterium]|nr:response regulator [Syntrophaceae bacterium]
VDDINTNLRVTKGLLTPYQMRVDLCNSGFEAIEAVKIERYDLVFMDHKMPEMDGVEATALIRKMGEDNPYYKELPIIALTANAVSGTREMFLQNGFNDFLSKPIDTAKLDTILGKWLPRDKQESAVKESELIAASNGRDAAIPFKIDGVELSKGISISGGTVALYLEVLATFYEDGRERVKNIKECVETGNLPLYTIYVHALKSALLNIGACMLSESAKALEAAGDRNDLAFIKTHNNEFLTALESLLDKINDCLSAREMSKSMYESPNTEMFEAELGRLRAAIEKMDRGVINETIGKLQKIAPAEDAAKLIKSISSHILLAEYDQAEDLIGLLLREIK